MNAKNRLVAQMPGVVVLGQSVAPSAPPAYSITGIGTVTSDPHFGVAVKGGPATVTVFGSVSGPSAIGFLTSAGYLVNTGQIAGTATYGVFLSSTGSVSNNNGGRISGATIGIDAEKSASVSNSGTITGGGPATGVGVVLRGGGLLRNGAAGLIEAGGYGVRMGAGGTVVNDGTIAGAVGAVYLGPNGTLIVNPAGTFLGGVIASGTNDTLFLGSSSLAGTLTGLGTSITGFGTITEAAGAKWTIANAQSLSTEIGVNVRAVLVNAGGTIGAGVSTSYGVVIDNRASIAGGVDFGGAGELLNTGSISGSVTFALRGAVSNGATAAILGSAFGVDFEGLSGSIVNQGRIAATASSGLGVFMVPGGDVVNVASGTISGGATGILVKNSAFIYNAGLLRGGVTGAALYNSDLLNATGGHVAGGGAGISAVAGSSVTNRSGALIEGGIGLRFVSGPGTASNAGTIAGSLSGSGVYFEGGGSLLNASGATISGGTGVVMNGPGTLDNAGTITGTSYAVLLAYSDTLVVHPGAVFAGKVEAPGRLDTLLLASAASAGTIGGIGTSFAGFTAIREAAGANWTLAGVNTIGQKAAFVDYGLLTIAGTLARGGGITRAGAGTVVNIGSVGATVYSVGGPGLIANAGTIQADGNGVSLGAGGTVTNAAGASLVGVYGDGIAGAGQAATVGNSGSIGGRQGGVALSAGGVVTNAKGASIAGGGYGITIAGGIGAAVTNAGSVYGVTTGIGLGVAGSVTNASAGTIHGGTSTGVAITSGAGTLVNAGSIYGGEVGAYLQYGGIIDNAAGATIAGNVLGIRGAMRPLTLTNAGTIKGGQIAVGDVAGAPLTNLAGGVISGGIDGVATDLTAAGSISNAGTIRGGVAGLSVGGTGTVVNQRGAVIGGATAVMASGFVTIDNEGTIAGSAVAVALGANVTLIDEPGAVFTGKIVASGSNDVLVLASGASAGTIGGIGSTITGLATIREAPHASWTLNGANTVAAATRLVAYGALVNAGSLIGNATVGAGGTLVNAGQVGGGLYGVGGSGQIVNKGTVRGTGASAIGLAGGGTITNQSGALIQSAADIGIAATGAPASVSNAGTIATYNYAIDLAAGGTITNAASGTILTHYHIAVVMGGGGEIGNSGTIDATNTEGLVITGGKDSVFNFAGGFISGVDLGSAANSSVYNEGSIGTGLIGVIFRGGGTLFNLGGGTISSGTAVYVDTANVTNSVAALIAGVGFGVDVNGVNETVLNAGSITATGQAGVYMRSGNTMINVAGAVVRGGTYGVQSYGGRIENAGSIAGERYAIRLLGDGSVVVDPGARFSGVVAAVPSFATTLELASAVQAGTIAGLSTAFTGFATIREDAGARWTLAGANSIGAGSVFIDNGLLTVIGSIVGRVTLGAGGTLVNDGSISGGLFGVGGPSLLTNAGTIAAPFGSSVSFAAGGTVSNTLSGVITAGSASSAVVASGAPVLVDNAGAIQAGNIGVVLNGGGTLSNAATGTINGFEGASVTAGTVTNAGRISGRATGLYLGGSGAVVTNAAGGTITGSTYNAILVGGSGGVSIVNSGSLAGAVAGVYFQTGGQFTNAAGGHVTGTAAGVASGVAATVVNAGTITGLRGASLAGASYVRNSGTLSGTRTGAYFKNGGTLINQLGGVVSGGQYGVRVGVGGAGARITNAGTISGGKYAVSLGSSGTLTIRPGAVFNGIVAANSYSGVLVLGSGASVGAISGIDAYNGAAKAFRGFTTITEASGANWILQGNNGFAGNTFVAAGTLTNAGTLRSDITLSGGAAFYNPGQDDSAVYGSGGPAYVTNGGQISTSDRVAVSLGGGGTVTNAAGATIFGYEFGVALVGPGTLDNSGTIFKQSRIETPFAVNFGGDDTLIVRSGSTIVGGAVAYGSGNQLILASSSAAGTISAIGSAYVGFGLVQQQAGGTWTFAGDNTFASGTSLVLKGTAISTGTVTASGFVYSSGLFEGVVTLGAGGTMLAGGTIAGGISIAGAGAYLTNDGRVLGTGVGVDVSASGASIKNVGSISGGQSYGIHLAAGGYLTNGPSGRVSGYFSGVFAENAAASVVNFAGGAITGLEQAGIYLKAGGSVDNNGTVTGLVVGVRIANAASTVQNAGTILGSASFGVSLRGGGSLNNSGHVSGAIDGVVARAVATLGNGGTISGFGTAGVGAYLAAGGSVFNMAGASITGTTAGIVVGALASATVNTAGTIAAGAGGRAIAFGNGNDLLVVRAGAVFAGGVDGGGGINTLELYSGGAGTIAGLGTDFTNFGSIVVDPTADWIVTGDNSITAGTRLFVSEAATLAVAGSLLVSGTVTDTGSILLGGAVLNGGTLLDTGPGPFVIGSSFGTAASGAITVRVGAGVYGTGSIDGAPVVDNGTITAHGGVLTVGSAVSGSGQVQLAAGSEFVAGAALSVALVQFGSGLGETLMLDQPGQVTSMLAGFGGGDRIDLADTAATALAFAGNTLTVRDGTAIVATLRFQGSYSAANFVLGSDGNGGSEITFKASLAAYPDLIPSLGASRGGAPFAGEQAGSGDARLAGAATLPSAHAGLGHALAGHDGAHGW